MNKIIIAILFLIFLLIFTSVIAARENEFGSVNAWVKIKDRDWQKIRVDNVTLKIGEPVDIKVTLSTKIECNTYVEIEGPGNTVTYELIEGPSKYSEFYIIKDCYAGWNETLYWRFYPTGNWTVGTAPLNLFVQFTKIIYDEIHGTYDSEDRTINAGLINAYISSQVWEGDIVNLESNEIDKTNKVIDSDKKSVGFEFILMIFIFLSFIMLIKKQRKI